MDTAGYVWRIAVHMRPWWPVNVSDNVSQWRKKQPVASDEPCEGRTAGLQQLPNWMFIKTLTSFNLNDKTTKLLPQICNVWQTSQHLGYKCTNPGGTVAAKLSVIAGPTGLQTYRSAVVVYKFIKATRKKRGIAFKSFLIGGRLKSAIFSKPNYSWMNRRLLVYFPVGHNLQRFMLWNNLFQMCQMRFAKMRFMSSLHSRIKMELEKQGAR